MDSIQRLVIFLLFSYSELRHKGDKYFKEKSMNKLYIIDLAYFNTEATTDSEETLQVQRHNAVPIPFQGRKRSEINLQNIKFINTMTFSVKT